MYENENQPTYEEISMPVFSEGPPPTITEQPIRIQEQEHCFPGTRRPIPVSTIDWQSSISSHYSPLNGLDFLLDVNQLIIQQTVELSDLMSNLESENRYTIKVPRGETIYYATETSQSCQRNFFGSSRAFTIRLYDPTQQEAVNFKRRLGCGSCCSLFCYLQRMEVWIPPGELVGTIKQNISLSRPNFNVLNRFEELLYRIEGPDAIIGCLINKHNNFQIYNGDGSTQVGSIIHQWDQVQVAYNLYLQLPGNIQDTRHKSLLLGAAFLLEYMYFENCKRKSCCKCIC